MSRPRVLVVAAVLAGAGALAPADDKRWTEGFSATSRGIFAAAPRGAEGPAGFKVALDPPSIRMHGRSDGWGNLREFNLGAIHVAGMGKAKVASQTWTGEVLDYGQGLKLHLTQLAPAVLVEAAAKEIAFFKDPVGGEKAPAAVRYVAFALAGGVKVARAGDLDLSGMAEPWLLCWFGEQAKTPKGRSPLFHQMTPVRMECPYPHREFFAVRDRYLRAVQVDAPMLLVLEHRPAGASLARAGLTLRFAGPAGRIVLMPAFGARWRGAAETEKWSAGLPDPVARRCRRFSRVLRAFPVGVRQACAVDRAGGSARLRETFEYVDIADDWKTPPQRLAPISPMLALAMRGAGPVRLTGQAKAIDLDLPTRMGPWTAVAGGQAAVEVHGILKYVFEKPAAKPAETPKELTDTLRREVDRMVAAGPLRPLKLRMGIGSIELYGSGAETAWLLADVAAAAPDLHGKLKAYLAELTKAHDPAASEWVQQGRPREYAPQPADVGGAAVPYRRAGLFNAYGTWRAIDVFGAPGERARLAGEALPRVAPAVARDLRAIDWAMGCAGPPAGAEQLNRLAAGAIGLARLGRLAGDAEAELRGTHLAAWLLAFRCAYGRYSQYHFERVSPMPEGLELYSYWAHNGAKFEPFAVAFGRHGCAFATAYQVASSDEFGLRLATISRRYHDQPAPAFLYLAPAVGRFLGEHLPAETANYLQCVEIGFPGWYLTGGSNLNARSEDTYITPELAWSIMQARLWCLGASGRDLVRYVDIPCCIGDLYFLHNVACILRAHGRAAWVPVGR